MSLFIYKDRKRMRIILILFFLILTNCGEIKKEISPLQETPSPIKEIVPPIWVETPEPPNFGNNIDTSNPNMLILGDSISIGYTGPLIKILGDKFDIRHPVENCRNSYYTLQNLDNWLLDYGNNSIITWNNGIWDSARHDWWELYVDYAPDSWYGVSLSDYENNIIQIARKLKSTGARVIFFTTTNIPSNSGVFEIGKELVLNDIAKRVLPFEGVEVYDLYSFGLTIPDAHTSPNYGDVHFKNEANYKIADWISKIVSN